MLKMPLSTKNLKYLSVHSLLLPTHSCLFTNTFSFGEEFFARGEKIGSRDAAIESKSEKLRHFNFTKDQCFDDLDEALMWYIKDRHDDCESDLYFGPGTSLPLISYTSHVLSCEYSGINEGSDEMAYVKCSGVDLTNFLVCSEDLKFCIEKYHLKHQNPSKNIESFKVCSFSMEVVYYEIISHDPSEHFFGWATKKSGDREIISYDISDVSE